MVKIFPITVFIGLHIFRLRVFVLFVPTSEDGALFLGALPIQV